MKIGRIDLTIPMLAYVVGVAAAFMALCVMWMSHAELRYESYYRGRILQAMNGEEQGSGIEACDALLAHYPDKVAARLFKANILYRQKQYSDAEEAFAGVTAMAAATPREKAWAWVGRGVAVLAAGAMEEKAVLKAEVYFEQALKEEKDCPDALIDRAIAQLYKKNTETALDEAEKCCKRAATASAPPALEAQGQFYILEGVINMRKGRPDDATAFFERSKAILPTWKGADVCQRNSILAAAVQKDAEPARRKDLLKQCESMAPQFSGQAMIMNALGVGWSLIKGEPEAEQQKVYKAASQFFDKAMAANGKDPLAYLNAAALREDMVADLAEKLIGPVTGIKGETPAVNEWLLGGGGKATALRFPPADKSILLEISRTIKEEEDIWQRYMEKAATKPSEKLEATLWLTSCIRRRAYLVEANAEPERASLLSKASGLIRELAQQNPENPQALFALGQSLLEKGDYSHAYAAYKGAAAKGMNTPELARILKALDVKVELVDPRPPKDRRALSQQPLIGGSIKNAGSLGVIKAVKMLLGDKEVVPVLVGMQVLYLLEDKQGLEGEPKVAISVTDVAGQRVAFEPFTIRLSLKPPTWSVQPEGGKELPAGKLAFTVALASNIGIEFGTLRLALKNVKSNRSIVLVNEGKCAIRMPDLERSKAGYPIDTETFQVSTAGLGDLTPGDWELAISVRDLSGNELSDVKKYTLK